MGWIYFLWNFNCHRSEKNSLSSVIYPMLLLLTGSNIKEADFHYFSSRANAFVAILASLTFDPNILD